MKATATYKYFVYSLNLSSEVELTGFTERDFSEDQTDVTIQLGMLPKTIDGLEMHNGPVVQSTLKRVLFDLADSAKILIQNGNEIIVEPQVTVNWSLIKNLIKNKGLAAILHQRSWGVLHGSAIKSEDKAVLFLGRSGAGKSTTTAALSARGYDYITDDLAVIKKEDGRCMLQPGYPKLRLWENSIKLINKPNEIIQGPAIRPSINKFYIEPKSRFHSVPIQISHIYVLVEKQTDSIKLEEVHSLEALKMLMQFTYAKGQMKGLGGHEEQFKLFSHLMQSIKVSRVLRPLGQGSAGLEKLISTIEEDFLA